MPQVQQQNHELVNETIYELVNEIRNSNIELNKTQSKVLRSAEFFPKQEYVEQLQVILNSAKTESSVIQDIKYLGNLTLDDFLDSKKLVEINNTNGKEKLYFYFDESFITNFDKLPSTDQDKFSAVSSQENIKFSASFNDQGIKNLKSSKNIPNCLLRTQNSSNKTDFTHELKIQKSTNRLGVITLKPLKDGPQILVATHVIKNGFHNKQHKGKTFSSNRLDPRSVVTQRTGQLVSKVGLFATPKTSCKKESGKFQINSNKPVLSK